MPLCVLLWIIVLIPAAALLWFLFSIMTEMDSDPAVFGLFLCALALFLAVPNLLWYQSVRDALVPANAPAVVLVEAPRLEK